MLTKFTTKTPKTFPILKIVIKRQIMSLIIILDKVLGITLKNKTNPESRNNLIVFVSHEPIKQFGWPVFSEV